MLIVALHHSVDVPRHIGEVKRGEASKKTT